MAEQQHRATDSEYSHLHAIWKEQDDAIRNDMIRRGLDPDAKPPGKIIKPYAVHEGEKFRLPTIKMTDKHLRCWWWNSNKNQWKFECRVIIGTGALDEVYHKDTAMKLISKGITHFIPYIENCPPLIFCNPLDFDEND